jgi:hypothetical protein
MRTSVSLIAFLALSIGGTQAQAEPDQAAADLQFHKLLDAQEHKDYDAFVANGTLQLKAALTKTQFDASSDLMIARLKGGCDIDSLGELNQKGYQLYLYKLRFKDGGDDLLGTLILKNGQVAGIYFH